jgi:DNA-binding protein YbaB
MADFVELQKKQAALEVSATAAEGSIEVTVNARGQVVKALIDKSYLDDHDFEELGDHLTEAAQAAARQAGGRVAEMLAPMGERQRSFPSFSDIVEGIPDLGDVLPPGLEVLSAAASRREGSPASWVAGSGDDGGDGGAEFPTVRR